MAKHCWGKSFSRYFSLNLPFHLTIENEVLDWCSPMRGSAPRNHSGGEEGGKYPSFIPPNAGSELELRCFGSFPSAAYPNISRDRALQSKEQRDLDTDCRLAKGWRGPRCVPLANAAGSSSCLGTAARCPDPRALAAPPCWHLPHASGHLRQALAWRIPTSSSLLRPALWITHVLLSLPWAVLFLSR